jgi:hypothetical protein
MAKAGRRTARLSAIGSAAMALACAGSALAADGSVFPPNYHFPDGTAGFMLEATNPNMIDPCWLIGFGPVSGLANPPVTTLDLSNPNVAVFNNAADGGRFMLEWSIVGFGDGSVTPPPAPNSDGFTSFQHVLDGHVFNSIFSFGPGPVDQASWVGFNPQPDPPGFEFGVNFTMAGDAFMRFQVTEDGVPLSFALETPEPATWSLMIAGFALTGAGLRRRGRAAAA